MLSEAEFEKFNNSLKTDSEMEKEYNVMEPYIVNPYDYTQTYHQLMTLINVNLDLIEYKDEILFEPFKRFRELLNSLYLSAAYCSLSKIIRQIKKEIFLTCHGIDKPTIKDFIENSIAEPLSFNYVCTVNKLFPNIIFGIDFVDYCEEDDRVTIDLTYKLIVNNMFINRTFRVEDKGASRFDMDVLLLGFVHVFYNNIVSDFKFSKVV